MRRLALIAFAASGLVAGCATPTERVDRAMTWGITETAGEGVKLTLGVPETDDLRIMMVCKPGSGEIDITLVAREGDPAAFELVSGEVRTRYAGAGEADEETLGAVDLQVKAKVSDPVMRRLADTGQLMVVFPERRILLPNAFSQAHDFLRRCRAP